MATYCMIRPAPNSMNPISEIYPLLQQPRRVVIIMHQKPDADAMGSSLGLSLFLRKLGHQTTVISPTNWAEWLKWMPGCAGVIDYEFSTEKAVAVLEQAEWIFCLDFNTLTRTRHMAPRLRKLPVQKILIDHHQQPESAVFAYGVSDTEKSSTSEMVYDVIVGSGHADKIDIDIAACLYSGVMTDTGSFRFPGASSAVHRMVAVLKDTGLNHTKIFENLGFKLRVDAFDILNHPNFAQPSGNTTSATFGQITATRFAISDGGSSRQLQLSGKFSF